MPTRCQQYPESATTLPKIPYGLAAIAAEHQRSAYTEVRVKRIALLCLSHRPTNRSRHNILWMRLPGATSPTTALPPPP